MIFYISDHLRSLSRKDAKGFKNAKLCVLGLLIFFALNLFAHREPLRVIESL